jgi:hypothetical protein
MSGTRQDISTFCDGDHELAGPLSAAKVGAPAWVRPLASGSSSPDGSSRLAPMAAAAPRRRTIMAIPSKSISAGVLHGFFTNANQNHPPADRAAGVASAGGGNNRVPVKRLSVEDQAVHIEDDTVGFAR